MEQRKNLAPPMDENVSPWIKRIPMEETQFHGNDESDQGAKRSD